MVDADYGAGSLPPVGVLAELLAPGAFVVFTFSTRYLTAEVCQQKEYAYGIFVGGVEYFHQCTLEMIRGLKKTMTGGAKDGPSFLGSPCLEAKVNSTITSTR